MATTKMSAETIERIKQMYTAGETYDNIAGAAHCGMGTIANVVKAAGLPPRKAKVVKPDLSYLDKPAPVGPVHPDHEPGWKPATEPKAKAAKKPAPRKPTTSKPTKRAANPATKLTIKHPKHATLKAGTVIKKLDRDGKVRATCTVVKDGFKYAGKVYASISSAAMAAMKKLGLKSKAVNGYVWWGIAK